MFLLIFLAHLWRARHGETFTFPFSAPTWLMIVIFVSEHTYSNDHHTIVNLTWSVYSKLCNYGKKKKSILSKQIRGNSMRLEHSWSQKSNLQCLLMNYPQCWCTITPFHFKSTNGTAVAKQLPLHTSHQAGEERLHHRQIHWETFRSEEVSWYDVTAPHIVRRSEGPGHLLAHPGLRWGSRPHGAHTSGQRTRQYTTYLTFCPFVGNSKTLSR